MVSYKLFPLVIVIAIVTSGFSQSNVTRTFTVNGRTHSCIWHVPASVNKPPVVFFVHGANGSGGAFQNETKGNTVADREGFIAVYPSASSNGNTGVWEDMRGTSDFPFYLAVIDTLDKRYSIDRNRIYMTGFSQGGFISFVAACSYSDVFAAVAPVSGHAGTSCTLKRPVSVYMTFGAQEDVASFFKDRDAWLKFDSCTSTPTRISPYPSSKPQSGITRLSYGPCAQGTYVIVDSIGGQGHQWPTKQNQAEEVWAFFKQFSLNSSTTNISYHRKFSKSKPVPVSYFAGNIHVHGMGKKCRVRVTDIRGKRIMERVTGDSRISFADIPSGIYLVLVGEREMNTTRIMIP